MALYLIGAVRLRAPQADPGPAIGSTPLRTQVTLPIDRRRGLLWEDFWRPRGRDEMTDIEAHITGTVWKIECAVGDTIEEGDTVAILESMKMEMPVEAEDAGTVKEILCKEGQAVNEGDTLVVLD